MARITYATIYSEGLKDEEAAKSFADTLSSLRASDEPIVCPQRIGGEKLEQGEPFDSVDPSRPDKVVSRGWAADEEVVRRAIDSARSALPKWRSLSWEERVETVQRLSSKISENRDRLSALLGLEVGKTRADSVAEVEECVVIVDLFCEQVRENNGFVVEHIAPSEDSHAEVVQLPYGVFGVIGPFNFPLAIPLAMSLSALITGNTVVLKPSALSPACGDALAELFDEIGLPAGAVNCIHGGAETGKILSSADVDGIVFTGSAEVGLDLIARLTQPPYARPVIAEMGGKNPAIVTGNAGDLEVAARAVVRSAFGMSGQKCNACSRAVVTEDIYDDFINELKKVSSEIKVGDSIEPDTVTGPLIGKPSVERYLAALEEARRDGRIVLEGKAWDGEGYFVEPTIVDELPKDHRLTREELFVPLLTVIRVPDLDSALAEANAIRYGLSAGIFSDDEAEQERFLNEIEAGIVFVNNPGGATTGVWPGSQTMAGWKGSGSSGKGGFGPWYLHQFVREQSRTEFK